MTSTSSASASSASSPPSSPSKSSPHRNTAPSAWREGDCRRDEGVLLGPAETASKNTAGAKRVVAETAPRFGTAAAVPSKRRARAGGAAPARAALPVSAAVGLRSVRLGRHAAAKTRRAEARCEGRRRRGRWRRLLAAEHGGGGGDGGGRRRRGGMRRGSRRAAASTTPPPPAPAAVMPVSTRAAGGMRRRRVRRRRRHAHLHARCWPAHRARRHGQHQLGPPNFEVHRVGLEGGDHAREW